ncbi:hypothetical protein V8E36_005342 [Tilletia maclaganii]
MKTSSTPRPASAHYWYSLAPAAHTIAGHIRSMMYGHERAPEADGDHRSSLLHAGPNFQARTPHPLSSLQHLPLLHNDLRACRARPGVLVSAGRAALERSGQGLSWLIRIISRRYPVLCTLGIFMMCASRRRAPFLSRYLRSLGQSKSLSLSPTPPTIPAEDSRLPRTSSTASTSRRARNLLIMDRVSVYTSPSTDDPPSYLLLQVPKDLIAAFEPVFEPVPVPAPAPAAAAAEAKTGADDERAHAALKRKRDVGDEEGGATQRKCFTINGKHTDSAVLCTDAASYTIRQIAQSNSLLLLTPSFDLDTDNTALNLQANLETILELVPAVPRLSRIPDLLRATAYQGAEEEVELQARVQREKAREVGSDTAAARRKLKMYTHRQLRSIVQASEAEFAHALHEYRVIEMGSRLRLVSSKYRTGTLMKLIHAQLMLDGIKFTRVPVADLVKTLAVENKVPEAITRAALLTWYGQPVVEPANEDREHEPLEFACLRPETLVRDIGLELLSKHRTPTRLAAFQREWKREVGELFEEYINASLLRGSCLLHPSPLPTALFPATGQIVLAGSTTTKANAQTAAAGSAPGPAAAAARPPGGGLTPELLRPHSIQYFPSSLLPTEPAQRFGELFLTRPHWTQDELLPFLEDLAPGSSSSLLTTSGSDAAAAEKRQKEGRKAIDSLLMKFTRSKTVKLAEPTIAEVGGDGDDDDATGTKARTGSGAGPAPGGRMGSFGTGGGLGGRKKAAAAAAAVAAANQVCRDVKVYSARMKY